MKLPKPHSPGQRELITSPQAIVCFAGRRFGKTESGVQRIFYQGTRRPGLYWWVGLTWRSASMRRAWRLIKEVTRAFAQAMGRPAQDMIREVDKECHLPNGLQIWMRSADNPESLAGEGIMGAVLDEFTLMQERVWTEFVEATLLDYQGWPFFIGVPKGQNWGAQLWQRAHHRPGWMARHYTTYDNPFLSQAAIDALKGEVPASIWRQEYLAEIVTEQDTLIPYSLAEAALYRHAAPGREERRLGIDVAWTGDDRTVFVLRQGPVVEHMRVMEKADPMQVAGWAMVLVEEWQADVVCVDTVGIGAGVGARLSELLGSDKVAYVNVAEKPPEWVDTLGGMRPHSLKEYLWLSMWLWFRDEAPALLADERLCQQLVVECATPMAYPDSSGRIQLERKDQLLRRGIRSPDLADALTLTFAPATHLAAGPWRRR